MTTTDKLTFSNILTLIKMGETDIATLINLYAPQEGYLYVLHNDLYKHYGENVNKFGNSSNLENRLSAYITPFLENSKYLLKSQKLFDKNLAEKILFEILDDKRISKDREFFRCDINKAKLHFAEVEKFFEDNNTKEKIIIYAINKEKINNNKTGKLPKYTKNENINAILNSQDIDIDKYNKLKEESKKRRLNNDEIAEINRCELKIKWKNANIDRDFLDNFYGKDYMIDNLRYIFDDTKIDMNEIKKYVNDIIKNTINDLGFNFNDMENIKLDATTFTNKLIELRRNCELFTNSYNILPLLNIDRSNILPILELEDKIDIKKYMGFINSILHRAGLVIKSKQKKFSKNRNLPSVNEYVLGYYCGINKYV